MNGSTQPSQLVEQVKASGRGNVHISEWFLSAQSSIRVTWLEEKVLPFILHFAVSWLWRSFTVLFMVLKSLLQLKISGKRGRKKRKISICRWSWAMLGLQLWRQKSPDLLYFLRLKCIQSEYSLDLEFYRWILSFWMGRCKHLTWVSYLGTAMSIKTVFQQVPSFVAKKYTLIAKLYSIARSLGMPSHFHISVCTLFLMKNKGTELLIFAGVISAFANTVWHFCSLKIKAK